MAGPKQYGLIIPNKKAGLLSINRPSIFNDDSDSDEPKLFKPTGLSKPKIKDSREQQKAVEEDPTVYQYDELYDEMENKKKETKLAKKDIDRKPKYINRLLVAADRRKRENEKRMEKQVQKEREAEGDEFKDKESFVTSAYKKKLEELRALEEQEKREEYLEAIGDVTKQGNLDGFYRHLYDQKVNYGEKKGETSDKKDVKKQIKSEKESSDDDDSDKQSKKRKSSLSNSSDHENGKKIKKNPGAKKRKYRSRKESTNANDTSDSETEKVEVKKEHLPSNLDADSDFSVDSDSESENEAKETKDKTSNDNDKQEVEKLQLPAKGNVLSDNAALAKKNDDDSELNKENNKDTKPEVKVEENVEEVKPKKPKVDIWKKRTVGEAFDQALMRYYQRKSERGW